MGRRQRSLFLNELATTTFSARHKWEVVRQGDINNFNGSYRKEKVSAESSDSSTSKVGLKKKTSHSLSDFLTGSPLKATEKDKVKEKKEKKHGKFHISSPLKAHKSKSGELPKSGSKSSASS